MDYNTAFNKAVKLANLCNREVGIEKTKEFGRTVYIVKLLPNKENRSGHELNLQVVTPGEPPIA